MKLLVKKIKRESSDSISIIFERPKNLNFYPGQYLDIGFVTKKGIDSRIMSISSSPSEDFLMITYKIGISPYKIALQDLKPGDIVESTHPAGTVVIDDSGSIVMIAGGIGIAPHRSMIKWVVDRSRLDRDKKFNLPITLIYSNSDKDFIFKKELDQWVKLYPKLNIHYVVTSKDGRLTEAKLQQFLILSSTNLVPIHYLAGPPSMVDDFENILLKLGVDETNIRTDRFDGY